MSDRTERNGGDSGSSEAGRETDTEPCGQRVSGRCYGSKRGRGHKGGGREGHPAPRAYCLGIQEDPGCRGGLLQRWAGVASRVT